MTQPLKEWYDSTSYSRGQERVPTCWSYDTGELTITVLNGHRYYPNQWIMHCYQLHIDTAIMKAPFDTPLKDVQEAAIKFVRRRLGKMLASMPSLEPENLNEDVTSNT